MEILIGYLIVGNFITLLTFITDAVVYHKRNVKPHWSILDPLCYIGIGLIWPTIILYWSGIFRRILKNDNL